jgi:hypothetical protein
MNRDKKMKKTIAGLLVLALSCFGCTGVMNVRGTGGFCSPTQEEGMELGIRIGGGSCVDKDVVSVDRRADLPVQNTMETDALEEIPVSETLIITILVISIVEDIFDSMPIFVWSGI